MVNIAEKDLESLYQQGMRGNAAGFALIGRQIVSKLKKSSPEVASKLAELLIGDAGLRGQNRPPAPVDADSRQNLLKENSYPHFDSDPFWDNTIAEQLATVLIEREKSKELTEAGLEPVKALIFTGPPGVGKTHAAHWLSYKLKLPIFTLDLATVMSSLLGKTGSNIKAVIDHAKETPCILFLDEFDAIAKKRDDEKDVGELKRLVNVLLQAIDEWPSTSILIAATNHPDMLDPAVWRRFEKKINFTTPSTLIVTQLLEKSGANKKISLELSSYLTGQSYSDIKRTILSAKKKSVIHNKNYDQLLIDTILETISKEASEESRDIKIIRLSMEGLSDRKIAAQLKISHPTVGKIIKEYKEQKNG